MRKIPIHPAVQAHPADCICKPCLTAEIRRLNALIGRDAVLEVSIDAVRIEAAAMRHAIGDGRASGWGQMITALADKILRARGGPARAQLIIALAAAALNWHRLATVANTNKGDTPTTQDRP